MRRKTTWVLVADAGRARVLQASAGSDELTLVEDIDHPIGKTSDNARDRLPRTFDSFGKGRHAIAPKSDPHRVEKKDFADELATLLDVALEGGAYDALVVIAPAQMIGDLRKMLTDRVREHLQGELVLDLTKAPISEIAERLKGLRAA